jgi:hypothetical protein
MTIDGLDNLRKQQGVVQTPSPTPQSVDSNAVSSQPIDMTGKGQQEPIPTTSDSSSIFSSEQKPQSSAVDENKPAAEVVLTVKPQDETQQKEIYTIKKGDNLWNVAKEQLKQSGIEKPNNRQIMDAMQQIAELNGCKNAEECKNKFFRKIGTELDITGVFNKPKAKEASELLQQSSSDSVSSSKETTQPEGNLTELERLIAESGIEGDIDVVYSQIKAKGSDISDVEKRIVELYQQNLNKPSPSSPQAAQTAPVYTEDEQKIISTVSKIMQSGILEKPKEEQLAELSRLCASGNKDFEQMPLEQQRQYLEDTAKTLAQLADSGDKYKGHTQGVQTAAESVRAIVIANMVKNGECTLEELSKMTSEERENVISAKENNIINTALSIITKSVDQAEMRTLSYKQRAEKYLDAALSLLDPDYKNKSEKEQVELRNQQILKFANKMGIKANDVSEISDKAYNHILLHFESIVDYCKTENKNAIDVLNNFDKMPKLEQLNIYARHLEKLPARTQEEQEALKMVQLQIKIADGLPEKATNNQVSQKIAEMLKNPETYNLSDDDKAFLNDTQKALSKLKSLNLGDEKFSSILTQRTMAAMHGQKLGDSLRAGILSGVNNDNIMSDENVSNIRDFLEGGALASIDLVDVKILINELKNKGISDENIYALFSKTLSDKQLERISAFITKPEEMSTALEIGLKAGKQQAIENIARHVSGWEGLNTESNMTEYGIVLASNTAATQSLYEGMWENGKSKEFVLNVTDNVGHSDRITEDARSNVYKTAVTTAPDDATKLYMGSELSSRTDNAAALEGLAAASNSIKDTNTRSQYNTHVDNAVNKAVQSGKYSSEEIAQIKKDIQKARETGMTKAETTQAKKTQQKVKTATQKAQQQQKAEQKAQKEALEQKQQTVLTHAKTVIASVTATKPKATSSAATSQTEAAKALEEAQKSLNQTLERLAKAQTVAETERVRQELLNRIEQFQTQVRLSQEERDLRIQLSEREAVNALLAESAAEEAQASQEAQEAVAVATDTEVTAEDGATTEVRSHAEKSGLSVEAVQELHEAYQSGGLTALYEKASTIIGSKAQERLLNYISHTSSSTLHSFADAHSGNKNILMTLFRNSKDPYIMQLLIRNGYASEVLGSGTITVKDFLSYASPTTVTNWITDLQKTGATYTLKEAFANIGNATSGNASALQPGSDAWLKAQRTSMAAASSDQSDNLTATDPAADNTFISSGTMFEDYDGLAMGSDRVRMGIPVDKRVDKRFFRIG